MQMERNTNLEEIDSDAPFGIDALKYQSTGQKILFYTLVLAAVAVSVLLPLFGLPRAVGMILSLILLVPAVAFGCNYTEQMTYGQYFVMFFIKPKTVLALHSTENMRRVAEKAKKDKREEELLLSRQLIDTKKEQKKLVLIMAAVILALITVFGASFAIRAYRSDDVHHVVTEKEEVVE